jgi:alginate O-acetyltransferase complex protein AlgI
MLFNSLTFLVFFAVVYALYWAIPSWSQKKILLLMASYVFYSAWNPPYVAVLAVSSTVDWWLARQIGKSENPFRRRKFLVLSLVSNLGLLGYFKYGSFLEANLAIALAAAGITYHTSPSSIVLPIGISFYTFASLSYTIDVYRKEIRHDWRFTDYALFVSFFPHLVAGPIVRAGRLLPQLTTPQRPTWNQVGWGMNLVVVGLFSKVVLADSIFAPVVDQLYAAPSRFGAIDTWIALLSFSGQIYFDFSGYSLCAIGLAMCFGIRFPENFRYPYAAAGFIDFWRRWHISLSTWLRDYLYIPLGGNRSSQVRTYSNLMITMLLGGLWHGASWMFVLWGSLHGIYLVVEHALRGVFLTAFTPRTGKNLLIGLFTFVVVTLTWIPFRASGTDNAVDVLMGLFRFSQAQVLDVPHLIALISVLLMMRWHFALRDAHLVETLSHLGLATQTMIVGVCLLGLFLCSGGDQRAFIYYQF